MGRRRAPKKRIRLKRIIFRTLLVLLVTQAVYLVLLRMINPPFTLTQLGAVVETKIIKRNPVALSEISAHVRLAVIAAEDQRFLNHNGFDWQSVRTVLRERDEGRRRLRGASTISQQVAKNVFLWQHRSWLRKGLEAYFTVLLELALDKRRILELYLNIAEMGPGIFGAEAAAQHYFGKPARTMNPREAALLAACLSNPRLYHPDNPSKRTRAKAEWILTQMKVLRGSNAIRELLR